MEREENLVERLRGMASRLYKEAATEIERLQTENARLAAIVERLRLLQKNTRTNADYESQRDGHDYGYMNATLRGLNWCLEGEAKAAASTAEGGE
jgi:hypothetical protein